MTGPRPPVPRSLRVVNGLALVLFLAGAGVYARAWLGMRALGDYVPDPDAPHFTGLARFTRLWELSRIGLGLVAAALGVAVLAAVAALVLRQRGHASVPSP